VGGVAPAAPARRFALPGAWLPADQWFALAATLALPFAYALTVDLRFPLKISEVALVLCAAAVALSGRLRAAPGVWRRLRPLLAFAAVAAAVLVARIVSPLPTLNLGTFATRFGPAGDGITKLVYLGLAIFALVTFSYAAYRDERLYVRVWLLGAALACVYTWVLFLSSVFGAPPPLLPGMTEPQYVTVAGRELIRSGTFKEGNHLGLYLVCSAAVALYARRRTAALLLTATTFITFSTANVIGLVVLWLGVGWHAAASRRRGAGRAAGVLTYVALASAALFALMSTTYAAEIIVSKLGAADSFSRLDRLEQTITGIRITADHPVLGVGISQYGYHYTSYQVSALFGGGERIKQTPNNVYIELLSETGVVGTALLGLFLLAVLRRTRGPAMVPLRWGLVAMLLVFGTFPSYTFPFLWAYWALILAAASGADAARTA
jgi:O-antigen ligase